MQKTQKNLIYIVLSFLTATLGLAGYIYCSRFSINYPDFISVTIGFTAVDFIVLCAITRFCYEYVINKPENHLGSMLFAIILTALTFYLREMYTPKIIERLLTEVPVIFILFLVGLVLVYYVFVEALRNKAFSVSIDKNNIISLALSILFVLAYKYTHTDDFENISNFLSRISVFEIMLVCILQNLLNKYLQKKYKFNLMYFVFAFILSFTNIVLNDGYKHADIFYSLYTNVVLYLFLLAIYTLTFYASISYILAYIEQNISGIVKTRINIFALALKILLLWSPIYLLFFPGAIASESILNINYFLKVGTPINFAPPHFQLFLGIFVSIGRWIGSDTMGIVIYFIVIGYISALAMAIIIERASRLNLSHGIMQFMYIFCIANPFIILKTFTMQYDSLLGIALLYFSILLYDITLQGKDFVNKKNLILLFISGFMLCVFRNVGKAILATSILVFSIYGIKKIGKRALLASLSLILALSTFIVSNTLLLKSMNYVANLKLANFAIPLQQISNVLSKNGVEALNNDEYKKISSVIDPKVFIKNANPNIVDPIKNQIEIIYDNEALSDEKFNALRSVWMSLGKRYPVNYIEAFIYSSYLYFVPGHFDNARDNYGCYVHQMYNCIHDVSIEQYKLSSMTKDRARDINLNSALTAFTTVFGLYMSAGAIQLIGIFILLLARQKKVPILCLLPSIIYGLGTVFTPVNGALRYMVPSGFVIPLFILYSLYAIKEAN